MKKGNQLFIKILRASAFALAGWILLAAVLAQMLIVEKPLERADVILVLAGSATYKERTRRAAELFNQGAAPRILLTDDGVRAGWSNSEGRNTPFAELARRSLMAFGVPPENIEILEPQVGGTIDEARLLRQKFAATNWQSILLVTSAYHSRRALRTFERVLNDGDAAAIEIGVEHAPTGEQTPSPFWWWLTSKGWNFVAVENVKSVYYWLYY